MPAPNSARRNGIRPLVIDIMSGVHEERRGWRPHLTGVALTAPAHVLDLVASHWLREPGRTAVVDPVKELCYGELDLLSAGVAGRLRDAGVRPGNAVVVHEPLGCDAIVAMVGALRAGARYVPIDATFPVRRRQRMLEESGTTITATVGAPGDAGAGWTAGPDAYTCFTSGSTGRPKGVTVSNAALAYSTAARLRHYGGTVRGFLLCSSLSFDSSVAGIYWTLASGGTLIIPGERTADPLAAIRATERHRPTHTLMVPSLYGLMLRGAARLESLRTVVVAGERCPPALVARHHELMPQARLYNEYGPTEATVWSTVRECVPADADSRAVPIGGPIPGTELFVRTPDGADTPPGEIGELWIGGPGVARPADGLRHPGFVDGRYRTGDLVAVRSDGQLDFHGRTDHQLKLGGVRIEPAEIEDALATVAPAGVGVAHRDDGTPFTVAFLVTATVDSAALRTLLLGTLPAAAIPARFTPVDALPTHPNGKLDRTTLDQWASGS